MKKHKRLLSHGQPCQLYKCTDKRLNEISATRLNVVGRVFLLVNVGIYLLRLPAYVITNILNNFVIGNDVMKRHKMIIDYKSDKLLIKAENVYTLDNVVIPPNSHTTIRVRS